MILIGKIYGHIRQFMGVSHLLQFCHHKKYSVIARDPVCDTMAIYKALFKHINCDSGRKSVGMREIMYLEYVSICQGKLLPPL
jgi:hypothetical protein